MSQEDAKVQFAMNLADYMTSRGVTRNDLSRATGIPYTTISNWLQGARFPRPEQLDKLAKYLQVSRADLLDDGLDEYEKTFRANQRTTGRKQELMFALWDGAEKMDEEDLADVLKYAEFVRARKERNRK